MPGGTGRKRKRANTTTTARKRSRIYRAPAYKLAILNNQQRGTLRYSQKFSLTPGSGVVSSRNFSANGVYDPDFVIGGAQPRGFDQLMTMYDHCVVLKSKCEVFVAADEPNTKTDIIDISLRDTAFTSSNYRDFEEYGLHKRRILAPAESGQEVGYLSMEADVNKFLGRSSPLSDPELKNSVGSNPKEDAWWTISLYSVSGAASVKRDIIVTITYDVVFIEPKNPSAS